MRCEGQELYARLRIPQPHRTVVGVTVDPYAQTGKDFRTVGGKSYRFDRAVFFGEDTNFGARRGIPQSYVLARPGHDLCTIRRKG